ncbi:peptide MFS transporter [Legionella sp. CNM-4043-24]|uniref:peptide MFS transporter n=1 Tax=Legionella sp. CNM-4043-24 TaxID=3421646 RepID=UPI00403A8617
MSLTDNKQPPSLRVFFLTEMWERYGFYVVQSLLALYMVLHFKWNDQRVYALVGSFTALTYLSPIIGGWVADNLLGQKNTIIVGTITLFLSYLSLAFVSSDHGLMLVLASIPVGTGLLKPNISSLLGNAYPPNAPQRESGFTIFYMGITTGIILGTTLPSQINVWFGWSVSFASAAFGMVIAFSVFVLGVKRYQITDYHPFEYTHRKLLKATALILALWGACFSVLYFPWLANLAFSVIIILSLTYLLNTAWRENPKQARQTLVIGLLCIISVMFWAFYFQMFMSLTLFISRVVEPTLFGISFPPPYYIGVQSVGMLIFGFFLSRKHNQISCERSGINTGNKFMLAMLFMVMAYTLITLVCRQNFGSGLLSPLLFIPAYLMISIAELLLSPVGLSAITILASRRKVSTMMGIFFVSLGIGGFLSGKLASLTAINPENMNMIELKLHYAQTFTDLLYVLLAATLLSWLLNVLIKRMLGKTFS